jgi:transposase
VLSIVDNRRFRRLIYEVLDHAPTHEDITRFLGRFKTALDARGRSLRGITTDGSALYPGPIAQVFGQVRHQVCQFHVIAELTKAVLHAVAKVRKQLRATMPKLGRGRPSAASRKAARDKRRIDKKIGDLFDHRYLFVTRKLTAAENRSLARATRGLPNLRALRAIMDHVYRLFDRRCRSDTALEKLARLRRRVRRFKSVGQALSKLFSPNIDKALTFLDDALLPATSNAVERANRRHRKMQKSVYRVRTPGHLRQRIAMDMQREARADARTHTLNTLHHARLQSEIAL